MRINPAILSIPPYISSSWKNIAYLHCEYKDGNLILIVGLVNETRIEIPSLDPATIEAVFAAHTKFLEQDQNPSAANKNVESPLGFLTGNGAAQNDQHGSAQSFGLPMLQIGPGGIENFGSVMQHNSEQSDAPDLPKEILNKIASITKAVGMDDPNLFPKPEPHCNCFHCQISRAIQDQDVQDAPPAEEPEEIVSDEELKFRQWDIDQTSEKLYMVTNPMDTNEHYSVFLGEPVGCTCGEKHCEHVRAVLNS